MAKFCAMIGFSVSEETAPDVWVQKIVEKRYSGEVIRAHRRYRADQSVNDHLTLNSQVSIIADAYAVSHYGDIRYVTLMGTRWKVTGIEIQRPRLLLDLGEIYNGEEPNEPDDEDDEEDDG